MSNYKLVFYSLFVLLITGCFSSQSENYFANIERAATQTGPTADEKLLDRHAETIRSYSRPILKADDPAIKKEFLAAYSEFLQKQFSQTYNHTTVAPAEDARFQKTALVGIELTYDCDIKWGDETFQKLLPTSQQVEKWKAHAKGTEITSAYFSGLFKTHETFLSVSGRAVDVKLTRKAMEEFFDVAIENNSDAGRELLFDQLVTDWSSRLPLLRDTIEAKLAKAEDRFVEKFYLKYGDRLELAEPFLVVKQRFDAQIRAANPRKFASITKEFRELASLRGKDSLPWIRRTYSAAITNRLAKLEVVDPSSIVDLLTAIEQLDPKSKTSLLTEVHSTVDANLDAAIKSSDVARLQGVVNAKVALGVPSLELTDQLIKYVDAQAVSGKPSAVVFFSKVVPNGKQKIRLIEKLLSRNAFNKQAVEAVTQIQFTPEEAELITESLSESFADSTFTGDELCEVATKAPPSPIRSLIFEETFKRKQMSLDDAGAVIRMDLSSREQLLINNTVETVNFGLDPKYSVASVEKLLPASRSPSLSKSLVLKLAADFDLDFAQIESLATFLNGSDALEALKSEAEERLAEATTGEAVDFKLISAFYEQNKKKLKLQRTRALARMYFYQAVRNGDSKTLLEVGKELKGYQADQSSSKDVQALHDYVLKSLDEKLIDGQPTLQQKRALAELIKLIATSSPSGAERIRNSLFTMTQELPLENSSFASSCDTILLSETLRSSEIVTALLHANVRYTDDFEKDMAQLEGVLERVNYIGLISKENEAELVAAATKLQGDVAKLRNRNAGSYSNLVRVFELVSKSTRDINRAKSAIAKAILDLSPLNDVELNSKDSARYLKFFKSSDVHSDASLKRLVRYSAQEHEWSKTRLFFSLLEKSGTLGESERELKIKLREALWASELADAWTGREIPLVGTCQSDGSSWQFESFIEIESVNAGKVEGKFYLSRGNPLGKVAGEINASGLELQLLDGVPAHLRERKGVFKLGVPEISLSSQSDRKPPADFNLSSMAKACETFSVNSGRYDFLIVVPPKNERLLTSVYDEFPTFKGSRNRNKFWPWVKDPVTDELKRFFFFAPWITQGRGRPRNQEMSFTVSKRTQEKSVDVTGEIYFFLTRKSGDTAIVDVFFDNARSPSKTVNLTINKLPNSNLHMGKASLEFSIPQKTRRVRVVPRMAEHTRSPSFETVFLINAMRTTNE